MSPSTWISIAERPPPAPKPDGRRLLVFLRMNDGREIMGHGSAAGGIRVLGANLKTPQMALLVSTATHWRPMDPDALEEFERG